MPSTGVVVGASRATDNKVPSPPRTMTRSEARAIRLRRWTDSRPIAAAVSSSKTTSRRRRRRARSRLAASLRALAETFAPRPMVRKRLRRPRGTGREPFIPHNLQEKDRGVREQVSGQMQASGVRCQVSGLETEGEEVLLVSPGTADWGRDRAEGCQAETGGE